MSLLATDLNPCSMAHFDLGVKSKLLGTVCQALPSFRHPPPASSTLISGSVTPTTSPPRTPHAPALSLRGQVLQSHLFWEPRELDAFLLLPSTFLACTLALYCVSGALRQGPGTLLGTAWTLAGPEVTLVQRRENGQTRE